MKIAHFIPSFGPITKGGAEIHIHNICKKLNERGHEAILITVENNHLVVEELPYQVVYIKKYVSRLLKYAPLIGKVILHDVLSRIQDKHRFDLWQVTLGNLFAIYSVNFFNRQKIPCILRCAGEDINRYPEIGYGYRLKPKFDALVRKYYAKYDALIALTPSVKKEYLDINIPNEKIHIISNGVDFNRFQKISKNNDIRKQYLCEQNTQIILTVGRHHEKKGYKYIPAIAEILIKEEIDFRWIIIGGKSETFNQEFPNAKQLNIYTIQSSEVKKESADLPPESLLEFYKSADLFVFPSLLETFGMVLVEAMAAGLPIITTNAPGVRDVVDQGETGMKVEAGNAQLMAKEILKTVMNEELRNKLSKNALEKAKQFYDWDIVLSNYLSLYQLLIK